MRADVENYTGKRSIPTFNHGHILHYRAESRLYCLLDMVLASSSYIKELILLFLFFLENFYNIHEKIKSRENVYI